MSIERRHTCLRYGWIVGLLVGWSINGQLALPEPTRILVKPRAGVREEELASLHAKSGCRLHRRFPAIGGLEVVEVAAPMAKEALLERYRNSALIEYCEPDAVVRAAYTPNDIRFTDGTLWNLNNTGQNGGVADADIDAPEGWDIQRDASSIVVAVIDSGVRYTHQDFFGNMWQNAGDIPGNRTDEDGNGYYNDVYGIDAIRQGGDPMDDHGHGTHVAGIIGARGDNSVGCVGVAPRVQIMALKFLNTALYGFISDAIECIDYARAKGARIINASWGDYTSFTSVALRDAIARARDAGIIFVTAAGNDGYNNDAVEFYPANYDLDNIISVAATTRRDVLASWSHYGVNTVDLGAPGEDVYSTWATSNSSYDSISGTSMATPHVVGVCALVWARYPSLTYRQVIQRVLNGVDPLPSLADRTVTGGRLNLQKALISVNSPPVLAPIGNKTADEGVPLSFTATASDAGGGPLTFSLDPGAPAGATINPTTGVFSWTPTEADGGSARNATIRVTDSASASDFETITITVREANVAPVLGVIGNKTVDEGVQLLFTATASDADGGALTFSLDSGAPAGATINPATGVFSWTPTESQGGSSSSVTIRVTDSASASDFDIITITVREVNVAPVLGAIGNKTVDEGTQLLFTATASDADGGALTFSLDSGAPAGAAISPATGMFSWTPTEADGGSARSVTVRVTDSASVSDFETITITVREANVAPVLGAIGNKAVDEGAQLSFTATASDVDGGALTFSLDSGAPAGATINPTTGVFSWTPTELDGGLASTVTIRVTDSASVSDFETITITVREVNVAPVLGAIGNKTVDEGTQLLFTATAGDADGGALTFTLDPGAPAGATINPTTGVFSWTPTEAQGGSARSVTIRVTDNASASDFETISINVPEVNTAPVLSLIPNQTNSIGNTINFRATATDADFPGNLLVFSLAGGPAGSAINATTGDFSWTPTDAQAPSTNVITVRVVDNGSPALEDSQAVMIVVNERLRITTARAAGANSVELTWASIPGKTYQIQYRNNLQVNGWTIVGSAITANGWTTSATATAAGGRLFFRVVQLN